mgnify:CR=1 FL=1
MKNWYVEVEPGTKILIRDVPKKAVEERFSLADDYEIEQVRARKTLRDSLLEEQVGLLKRLEEIKKLLEEQQ